MRVYISVDMEGITGAAAGKHVQAGEKDYDRFRRLMTQEANAAVEGARAAGATDVVVSDGHGPMTNIMIEELHPGARLISGSNKLFGQLEGIDRGFDAAFFVGYHQREGGGDGIMNHTYLGRFVYEIRMHGEPVDEAAVNAGLAGAFNVPVALVTGDDQVCADAERRLPGVVTAPVKEALDRFVGLSLTPTKAQELIRERARQAVEAVRGGRVKPYRVKLPVTFEVDFKRTSPAHLATLFPGVERRGPRTIAITQADYVAAFKLLWGTLIIALAVSEGLL
ncbi:MAG: M55 family metallopeptidase [Armatimonadota bacterium]|nr:M55 family metallopeptidase [Armatimonadota bacterium]MDR7451712.1 M55 family metallopeptidase [Armatimonadota bacterium]MDR7465670.1 M55 family metallopeptidase [Armatimonadota bacterium]MDR7493579.1 M55 family metallopeptidase [Armatimonadota bacterium]MDR7499517.1 M55 family metallopeptidase [Armatimonadota bacterium]